MGSLSIWHWIVVIAVVLLLFGRGKTILLDHYDAVTGRRRSVFPFTQQVKMPLHWEDDKVNG